MIFSAHRHRHRHRTQPLCTAVVQKLHMRERETERQTKRQTERQTDRDRQTGRQTQRGTEKEILIFLVLPTAQGHFRTEGERN